MKRFLTHFKGKDFGFKELQLSERALYTPLTAQQAKFAFYFTLKRHNKRGSYLPSHGIYGKSCKLTWETTETQGKLWGFFHRTGAVPLGLKFTDLPSSVVVQYGEKQHPMCMPGIHKILWKWSVCINTVLFGFTSSAFLYIWIVIFPSPCYGTHIWPLEPAASGLEHSMTLVGPFQLRTLRFCGCITRSKPKFRFVPRSSWAVQGHPEVSTRLGVPPLSHTLWPQQGAMELKTRVNILSFASAMTP